MIKYILDSDIGDDIDDALALDLALKKGLELEGVTTVYGDTIARAGIAKKILELYNRDIPVYYGSKKTIDGKIPVSIFSQRTDDLKDEKYAPLNKNEEDAIDFIISSAKKYGKNLVILAIGPLTNIARAIQKDGEAMSNTGGIVMMGGNFKEHYVEWNIRCDIMAAAIVFNSDVKITAFGHEVTSLTEIPDDLQSFLMNNNSTPVQSYLSQLCRLWYSTKTPGHKIILHDLFVIRYALEGEFCPLREAPVAVETQGKIAVGLTVSGALFDDGRFKNAKLIKYAESVDAKEFINYFAQSTGYKKGENI